MTPDQFKLAMANRGFRYDDCSGNWYGPFNIIVPGAVTTDGPSVYQPSPRASVDNAIARADLIRTVDVQLAAKRGVPRPPLVKSVDEFTTNFTPNQAIQPQSFDAPIIPPPVV
jgi:hypothetical protein